MLRASLLAMVLSLMTANASHAQTELLSTGWTLVDTGYFEVFSQLPVAETQRIAAGFHTWRHAASAYLQETAEPKALVPTKIYLFNTPAELAHFTWSAESAAFHPSPRSNFIALNSDVESLQLARHQYSHFLINNLMPQVLARWVEEGLASYLGRLEPLGAQVILQPLRESTLTDAAQTNAAMPLATLLLDENALASPLLVQLANDRSAQFFDFLQHAHEYLGFADYRPQLQAYLQHLYEGRSLRYAFERAFTLSITRMEAELLRFREMEHQVPPAVPVQTSESNFQTRTLDSMGIALELGELALHAGQFAVAEQFFTYLVNAGSTRGRAHAGLADSLRMQDITTDLHTRYRQALALNPDDPILLLDYGQFIESELERCDLVISEQERADWQVQMQEYFQRAVQALPDSPESNLSMAQVYLLPGAEWQQGLPFHQRAMELLAADSFVAEQAVNYAIADRRFADARQILDRLARPMHLWGEFAWIVALNDKLDAARRNRIYDDCVQ